MGFLFSGIFWGIVLIILGISVIINMVFHIHIPLFRILFALFLIYLGLRVMLGGQWSPHAGNRGHTVLFGEGRINNSKHGEINVIFGKGTIDSTAIFAQSSNTRLEINSIFSGTIVKIPRSIPVIVEVNSVLAGVRLPDGSTTAFGEYSYRNAAAKTMPDSAQRKTIDLSCVFSGCQVIEE